VSESETPKPFIKKVTIFQNKGTERERLIEEMLIFWSERLGGWFTIRGDHRN
jgi:hypothetical protein